MCCTQYSVDTWLPHLLSEQTWPSSLQINANEKCPGCDFSPGLFFTSSPTPSKICPLPVSPDSMYSNERKESKTCFEIALIWRSNFFSFFPLIGMATEVWLPSPHRTGNVCHALGPNHALSHCNHAACVWPQCHRDTGWENQGVSTHTCIIQSWGAHELLQGHWCHISANAPLINLKCRRNGCPHLNEFMNERTKIEMFISPLSPHLKQSQVKVLTLFLLLILHDDAVISRWGEN